MANKRVGGIIYIKADGNQFNAKGKFTYNLGANKRDEVVGHDGVHGFKELPQAPYVDGTITDNSDLSLADDLLNIVDATITLELANGKTVVLNQASYTADGEAETEEGEVQCKFVGFSAQEF